MFKKVIGALFLIFTIIIAFLLGLIITARSMSKDVIRLALGGKKTSFEIELVDEQQKSLVPTGYVTSDKETDVIELKFKFQVQNNSKELILKSEIDSIIDDKDNEVDIDKYFIIKHPNNPLITRTLEYIVEIRLKVPSNQEEYQYISSNEFKINISFWVEEP